MTDYEKLAYWLGVVQTDGTLHRKKNKTGHSFYVDLRVSEKSLCMIKKFKQLTFDIFARNVKILYYKKTNIYIFRVGVMQFMKFFADNEIDFSDPPTPPTWVPTKRNYLGAYLAGIIDGDGDVRVKRKLYPQCTIRISSGKPQIKLASDIENKLSSKVSITKRHRISFLNGKEINGTWFELEFYLSQKNILFFKEFVLPHISLIYKKDKMQTFMEKRYAPAGI